MPRENDAALRARVEKLEQAGLFERPVYGWDLDSTVCSTVHRRHMVPGVKAAVAVEGESAWDAYAMQCFDDVPVPGSVALMRELPGSHIAVSGRSGMAEDLTWAWLREHDVPMDAALLRPHGDHTPNGQYKVRVLRAMQAAGADIRLFFEDWDEAAKYITEQTGIPHFGVNPFDPKDLGTRLGAI